MAADNARDFRLINACLATSSIWGPDVDQNSAYYRRVGFIPGRAPQVFLTGTKDINEGFLCETTDGKHVLAFRGTLSPGETGNQEAVCLDWTQDRDYSRVSWDVDGRNFGAAARGLSTAARSLWDEGIGQALAAIDWSGKELWITGHSKGGAIAMLLATLANALSPRPPLKVVTFGAPRCGMVDFGRSYDSAGLRDATTRYMNKYDIIPQMPDVTINGIPGTGCPAISDPFEAVKNFVPLGMAQFIAAKADGSGYDTLPAAFGDSAYQDALQELFAMPPAAATPLMIQAHDPHGDYLHYFGQLLPSRLRAGIRPG